LSKKLQLLVISDGKPGHENQSLGLAEAMARLRPAVISVVKLDSEKGFFGRLGAAVRAAADFPKPDFVIAAGHATHVPLLRISRKYGARSILLMKPSLPVSWFGWCIAPEHDFLSPPPAANLILSKGALNRVTAGTGMRKGKLFLIGGPSKTHGYDEAGLVSEIRRIAGNGGWQLADSRRTPATFLPAIRKEIPEMEIFPHQESKPGWLAGKLAELGEIRVTEDSVSMIYEALTGGARVGVLEMPRLRPDARVVRGLETLAKEGYLDGGSSRQPPPLAEANRCAAIILAGARHGY